MHPADMQSLGPELETTLRLMHELVRELDRTEQQLSSLSSMGRVREIIQALRLRGNFDHLPATLLRVYAEIMEALHGIRLSRETIQAYSVERIKDTHSRLSEVSDTTESAALEMLNGLDRSLATIDQLAQDIATGNAGDCARARLDGLRAEVNNLYGSLQFQDIIAQKLAGVTALLGDIEARIHTIASLFDGQSAADREQRTVQAPPPETYNADASVKGVAERQALADAAFSTAQASAPAA